MVLVVVLGPSPAEARCAGLLLRRFVIDKEDPDDDE